MRSNVLIVHIFPCSDEALDMEDSRRQRSESSTADDVSHATHIAVSYIDKHYPQYKSVSNSRKREFEVAITSTGITLRARFSRFLIFMNMKLELCTTRAFGIAKITAFHISFAFPLSTQERNRKRFGITL